MAKAKKKVKRVTNRKPVKTSAKRTPKKLLGATLTQEVPSTPSVVLPQHEGAQVTKILDYGHVSGFRHCQLDNGTTAHVPEDKFNG